ncbi:hypothetical protein Tco_0836452 [Tanacetum coccineum]
MQSSFPQSPPKGSSQTEGEHIKKDKGKKALSSKEAIKESTESDSDDDETHLSGSMVESSRIKKVNKFDLITKDGKHIHLIEEQINQQKKIEEEAKPEAAKRKSEVRKEELIDLLGLEVVNNYLHLGKWIEVMKACPNRTGNGWETIYKQIGTRMDYIHITEAELGINLDIPLSKQDPLDKLNDLPNKKRKHVDDIHDYFKANKRLKSSVQYKDHLLGTVLNEPVLGMILFNSYHRQDFVTIEDFRDFSNTISLLLAKIDKRNLNPLKQMRVIEQLSSKETKEGPWLELQFSMVDNSKLSVVYLLNRS